MHRHFILEIVLNWIWVVFSPLLICYFIPHKYVTGSPADRTATSIRWGEPFCSLLTKSDTSVSLCVHEMSSYNSYLSLVRSHPADPRRFPLLVKKGNNSTNRVSWLQNAAFSSYINEPSLLHHIDWFIESDHWHINYSPNFVTACIQQWIGTHLIRIY